MSTSTADSWTIPIKLNNLFKHQFDLVLSAIRKILMKCEDTQHRPGKQYTYKYILKGEQNC